MAKQIKDILGQPSKEEKKILRKLRFSGVNEPRYSRLIQASSEALSPYLRSDVKLLQRLNKGRISTILCGCILAKHYEIPLRGICLILASQKLIPQGIYQKYTSRISVIALHKEARLLVEQLERRLHG